MKYLFVFGNTPDLAKAELEAVLLCLGLPYQQVISEGKAYILETEKELSPEIFERLGGTVKVGVIIDNTDFSEFTGTKLEFGVSFLGAIDNTAWKQIYVLDKQIKEQLALRGVKARFVLPVKGETELSSVVVAKQKLTEISVYFDLSGNSRFSKTIWVQNFEDWGKRDYGRPQVEAHVGMMPPKVAREMINLANFKFEIRNLKFSVLDPFCGVGTILAEALVLGFEVVGSDLDQKQVDRTKENLRWLSSVYNIQPSNYKLSVGDAREIPQKVGKVDAIITEPDLGPNGTNLRYENAQTINRLEKLYLECFSDWKKNLKPHGKVVIALPSFGENSALVKNVIDNAEHIGYILLSGPYIYARPQAKVKRNICVFELK